MRFFKVWILLVFALTTVELSAWGGKAHEMISDAAVENLPEEMYDDGSGNAFSDWKPFLGSNASTADGLKGHDSGEGARHYINLDKNELFSFPFDDFPRDSATFLTLFERRDGVCAWEGVEDHLNALTQAFAMRNWHAVQRVAADLGHYIEDCTSPMHSTANFNGQLTGNRGIHSRHESELVNRHINAEDLTTRRSANPLTDEIRTVEDPVEFAMEALVQGFALVNPILAADIAATQADPSRGGLYYQMMFDSVGEETIDQINDGAQRLADLWHTAWIDAGRPSFDPSPIAHTAPLLNAGMDGILSEFTASGEWQTNTTDLGDNVNELDQMLMGIVGDKVLIGLGGNLSANHAITMLLDTVEGGTSTLSVPGALTYLDTLNGKSVAPGFTPDHLLSVMHTGSGLSVFHVNLSTGTLTTLGAWDFFVFPLDGGGAVALDNSNTGGVSDRAGQVVRGAGDVTTGLELVVPLALLGVDELPVSEIGALALLTSSAPGAALSNQMLPGLPFGEYGFDHPFAQTSLDQVGWALFAPEVPPDTTRINTRAPLR